MSRNRAMASITLAILIGSIYGFLGAMFELAVDADPTLYPRGWRW